MSGGQKPSGTVQFVKSLCAKRGPTGSAGNFGTMEFGHRAWLLLFLLLFLVINVLTWGFYLTFIQALLADLKGSSANAVASPKRKLPNFS